ncbi:uncharacterized protein LOC136078745 [Hydra vulgaris]|uniref:Uncharacterized protein LOC136078745 n=1 Tax=Hydra vulgaris TaxID=6087 RepID=A0ABM4BNF4_HYDVU
MTTSKVLNFTEITTVDEGVERFEFHELGMLKHPNDFQLAQGLNQLWYKDSATTAVLADNSGFCDDYDTVIYGFKHTLTLVRKSDCNAILRLAAVAAGKVNLDKISLFIPYVTPSDIERIILYKSIEPKVTIPVNFRVQQCDNIPVSQSTIFSWRLSVKTSPEKPRYIVVGFQTNKDGGQDLNLSIFDRGLKNMYIILNQERYPAVDYNLSFLNHQFSRTYRDLSLFSEKFYGMNELITQSNIIPSDYKDLYPLFVIDVSKQSERLKSSVVDVQIKATYNAAVAADTEA